VVSLILKPPNRLDPWLEIAEYKLLHHSYVVAGVISDNDAEKLLAV